MQYNQQQIMERVDIQLAIIKESEGVFSEILSRYHPELAKEKLFCQNKNIDNIIQRFCNELNLVIRDTCVELRGLYTEIRDIDILFVFIAYRDLIETLRLIADKDTLDKIKSKLIIYEQIT